MVASFVKALGAVVVGTPVAVVLGLTARSIKKQEDASVPVIEAAASPLVVTVFSNWLDKRTHAHLAPTSFKPGYAAYDLRVENRTRESVKGAHVELVERDGTVVGTARLGEVEAGGHSVFAAKKAWNRALEADRVTEADNLRAVVTWRAAGGRQRAVLPLPMRRVLGEKPSEIRARRREKPLVTSRVMS